MKPAMTCHVLRMLIEGLDCLQLSYISIRTELGTRRAVLTTATDEDAHAIAKACGVEIREVVSGTSAWLSVLVDLDGVGVVITGPTRERAPQLGVVP